MKPNFEEILRNVRFPITNAYGERNWFADKAIEALKEAYNLALDNAVESAVVCCKDCAKIDKESILKLKLKVK
jgi:histone H3/H4